MMDMQNCPNHSKENVPLVGRMEQREGICTACIEVRLKRIADLEVKLHDTIVDLDITKRAKVEADERVQKFQSLMKAEMEGVSAADRALDEDQNPYPDGELCIMWLNGHQSVETRRRVGQAIAVMRWAGASLLTIQELARGYGQHEIADKIGTVAEKLEPFQGG